MDFIASLIKKSAETKIKMSEDKLLLKVISDVSAEIVKAYKNGNKVLAAGNGGSAADAQHFIAEFVGRFYYDRPALAGVALTTDTSILTAIGNDYGYDDIFARQINGNAISGDVFLAISTSGNSSSILKAIEAARAKGVITVGLTGGKKCKMDDVCDYIIKIPSEDTPRIQEGHLTVEHIICQIVEAEIFPK